MRIGELMSNIPKAKGGQPFHEKSTIDSVVESRPETKSEVIRDAGLTQKQVERFQTMASHPEIVAQAKAEARISKPTAVTNLKNRSLKSFVMRKYVSES